MKFEWEDAITVDLPEGWTLNEPGDVIEVVPPDESGALHVSILDRERVDPPSIEEAAELVKWFQRRRGADVDADVDIETFRDHAGVPAARCVFTAAQDGAPMAWVVLSKIWPDLAVLATYAHDPAVSIHAAALDAALLSIVRSRSNS